LLNQVVDQLSARIGLPNEKMFSVDADHRTICKMPNHEGQAYEAVGAWIAELVKQASAQNEPADLERTL
jgi:hypothetical protein